METSLILWTDQRHIIYKIWNRKRCLPFLFQGFNYDVSFGLDTETSKLFRIFQFEIILSLSEIYLLFLVFSNFINLIWLSVVDLKKARKSRNGHFLSNVNSQCHP